MKIILFSVFLSMSSLLIAQKNSQYGVIETPESQVFYEGIPIQLNFQAVGEYSDLELNIPNPYTAPIGSAGRYIRVSCTGLNKKGKRVEFGHKNFIVLKAPKPELYWGDKSEGEIVTHPWGLLKVKFDDYFPFSPEKANCSVTNYEIKVEGYSGTIEGEGDSIEDIDQSALTCLPSGTILTISVKYSGTSSGVISSMFEYQ